MKGGKLRKGERETKEMAAVADGTSLQGTPLPKSTLLVLLLPSLPHFLSFCLPGSSSLLSFSFYLLQINYAKREKSSNKRQKLRTFSSLLCSWCVPSEEEISPKTGVKLSQHALMPISICQYEQFFPSGKDETA